MLTSTEDPSTSVLVTYFEDLRKCVQDGGGGGEGRGMLDAVLLDSGVGFIILISLQIWGQCFIVFETEAY